MYGCFCSPVSNRSTKFAKIVKCLTCSPEFASVLQTRALTWRRPPKRDFFSLFGELANFIHVFFFATCGERVGIFTTRNRAYPKYEWMNEESHSKLYVMPLAFSPYVLSSMVCLSDAIAPKSKQTLTQMSCSFQSAIIKSRIWFKPTTINTCWETMLEGSLES
jgi:hypothetical protein